jgi:hypothetical protein
MSGEVSMSKKTVRTAARHINRCMPGGILKIWKKFFDYIKN